MKYKKSSINIGKKFLHLRINVTTLGEKLINSGIIKKDI